MGATVEIGPGVAMPLLGLGTFTLVGEGGRDAIATALACGYRHLDTANAYDNEADVGAALARSGISRQEVFLTTKVARESAGEERAATTEALLRLGVEHVDLLLVHWPADDDQATVAQWEALIGLRADGLTRSIGVSNFTVAQVDLIAEATGEPPQVNQIQYSPFLHDPDLLAAHRARGIAVAGYKPLRASELGHPVIADIAGRRGCTPAQVVIAWHLARDVAVLPRSTNAVRLAENWAAQDLRLGDEDLARLDRVRTS